MPPEVMLPNGGEKTDLNAVRLPVKSALHRLDGKIQQLLCADTKLIEEVSSYMINSAGKRIRPTMLLLAAGTCKSDIDDTAIAMAAVVEFIHGATLLHDDVVDSSDMRRGKPTANQRWGNETSVLVGDFLYSRAFQVMVRHASGDAMAVMADTTNKIAEGEVCQLINRDNGTLDRQGYLEVIAAKTACLFSAAARLGAMVATTDREHWQEFADYGFAVGMAYQLVDDVLDYDANLAESGKNPGDDLRDGKITMPLLCALQNDNGELRELLEKMRGQDLTEEIISVVRSGSALGDTMDLAKNYNETARQCLSRLPDNDCLKALYALTEFGIRRRY